MRERVHHYRYCPQCKANVEPYFRFCRVCYFWLAGAEEKGLRNLHVKPETTFKDFFSRFWLGQLIFQGSYPMVLSGIMMVTLCFVILSIYSTQLGSFLIGLTPKANRNTCYENMRVIQTGIEAFCMEKPFTRELASDPAKVLLEGGFLRNLPKCPIPGNVYKIPKHMRLQCIGSAGHGLP